MNIKIKISVFLLSLLMGASSSFAADDCSEFSSTNKWWINPGAVIELPEGETAEGSSRTYILEVELELLLADLQLGEFKTVSDSSRSYISSEIVQELMEDDYCGVYISSEVVLDLLVEVSQKNEPNITDSSSAISQIEIVQETSLNNL